MKIKILSIAVGLFLLTGCSTANNVLTCTNNENANGLNLDEKVVITFDGKKASKVAMKVGIKATDDNSRNMWSELIDFYTKKFPETSESGLVVKAKDNSDNYQYTINMTIDLDKVTSMTLNKYELEDLLSDNDTIDDIKLEAEQSGFTCSIAEKSI